VVFVDVYNAPTLVAFPERPGAIARVFPKGGRLPKAGVFDMWTISPDGDLLAAGDSYGGDIIFRDPLDPKGPAPLPPLGRYIYGDDSAVGLVALDAQGERAVVVGFIGDGQNSSAWAQSYDLAEDRPEAILSDDTAIFCTSIALVPGTDLAVLPLNGSGLQLADRKTGAAVLLEDADAFQCVAVGRNGALVAGGSANGDLVLWDRESRRQLACVKAHADQICGLGWQPGGDILATSSQDGTARLWSAEAMLAEGKPRDPKANEKRRTQAKPLATAKIGDMLYQVVFSADGALCAVGTGEGGACVVRVPSGEIAARLEGHGGEVMALAFHPITGHLVTASNDGTLKAWDVATGAALLELAYDSYGDEHAPNAGITSVGFDAAGRIFVIGHMHGIIRMWRISGPALQASL
jgi:WD40 repeat protein